MERGSLAFFLHQRGRQICQEYMMFKSGFLRLHCLLPAGDVSLCFSQSSCFFCLGRRGVGSIRLAWGSICCNKRGHGDSCPQLQGAAPHEACPGPCGRDSLGESRQEGRMCQRGKTAVGAENDLDAEKRPAWKQLLSTETLGPPWPAAAGLVCSAPAILGRNLQGAGGLQPRGFL